MIERFSNLNLEELVGVPNVRFENAYEEVRVSRQLSGHLCSICGDASQYSFIVYDRNASGLSVEVGRFRTCEECEEFRKDPEH